MSFRGGELDNAEFDVGEVCSMGKGHFESVETTIGVGFSVFPDDAREKLIITSGSFTAERAATGGTHEESPNVLFLR